MADLEELAGRVEGLSGPDRGIDALIMIALNPERQTIIGHKPGQFPREPIYGPITEFVSMAEANGKDAADYLNAPQYTASIDAAMTLVPKGLRLMLSEWDDEEHLRPRGPWQAVLSVPGADASFDLMRGYRCEHGATPAIALTAASLRALSRTQGNQNG